MSTFKLNSNNQEFNDRQKKVFDQLRVLENNRKNTPPSKEAIGKNIESRADKRAKKSETRHFRGKESIFKKPQNPAPKNYINRIPDFKKNPHKWTKYSLEDVQDVTDESNKKSAMDFLRELAKRKKMEQGIIEEEKLEKLPNKIVFNKHVTTVEPSVKDQSSDSSKNTSDQIDDKPSFSNSKIVMPEYVIGQKPAKKDKKIKRNKPEKGKELRLDHLMFEDD